MAMPAQEPIQLVPRGEDDRADSGPVVAVWGAYPAMRAGIRALLDEVSIAGGGESPDVVVADAGEEPVTRVLQEVRERHPGVPIVVLASDASAYVGVVAEPEGPAGMLLRDVTATELEGAVRAVAAGLMVLDPEVAAVIGRSSERTGTAAEATGELLTERELDVLRELALGLPNKAIALRLGISEHTVKYHVGEILAKLDAASRTEAVMLGARRGLLPL